MEKLSGYAFSLAFVACVAIILYHGDIMLTNPQSVILEEQSSIQDRLNSVVKKAGKTNNLFS